MQFQEETYEDELDKIQMRNREQLVKLLRHCGKISTGYAIAMPCHAWHILEACKLPAISVKAPYLTS